MAIYSFQHKFVSLKQNGAGRAAAGVRYITRSVADNVTYIGFSPNKFVARKEMQAIEDAQRRKDGRIYHLFIGAIPRELSDAEKQQHVNRVAWRMSNGGKAWVIAAMHDQRSHNPHMHLILVDRTVSMDRQVVYEEGKNGRRRAKHVFTATLGNSVNLLTHSQRQRMERGLEPNATEWARKLWQDVSNDALERGGYDDRIDRRTLLEQGIDREAQKHFGVIRDGDEVTEPVNEATVIGPDEVSPEVHTEELPDREEARASELQQVRDVETSIVIPASEQLQELSQYHGNAAVLDTPPHAPTDQLEEPAAEAQADHIGDNTEKVSDRLPEPDMTREEQLDAIRQELSEQEREEQEPERTGHVVAGKKPESVAGKVKGSIELAKRGNELRGAKSRLQTALDWGARANEAAATANLAYNQLQDDTERFNDYHRGAFGRGLAGVNVFGFKLFGRKEAEAAQKRVQTGQATYKALYDAYASDRRVADEQESTTRADQQRIEGYAAMTPEQRREALKGMAQAAEIIDQSQAETLKDVTGEQVYEAFKRGELTADEAQEACHWLGDRAHAARIAQEAEQEEEHELGM